MANGQMNRGQKAVNDSPPNPSLFRQDAHRAKVEASTGAGANPAPAKRHQPDPGAAAAAAAMAAMHEHQMAAMFAANAAAGMAAMHTLPGLAQGLTGPSGPGPHLKDDKKEVSSSRGRAPAVRCGAGRGGCGEIRHQEVGPETRARGGGCVTMWVWVGGCVCCARSVGYDYWPFSCRPISSWSGGCLVYCVFVVETGRAEYVVA